MEIKPYGDFALLVNFQQAIDPEINQQVLALDDFLQNANDGSIQSTIPAYCSLVVVFDPKRTSYHDLRLLIQTFGQSKPEKPLKKGRRMLIPVCYHKDFGLDLTELSDQLQLAIDQIINMHCTDVYQVYMLGFLPGFAYMGKLTPELHCGRKKEPRKVVPAQSVGLAGAQTGIYPMDAPGGWQIVGRTPIAPFNHSKTQPFLYKPGDLVKFQAVSREQYHHIENEVALNQYNLQEF